MRANLGNGQLRHTQDADVTGVSNEILWRHRVGVSFGAAQPHSANSIGRTFRDLSTCLEASPRLRSDSSGRGLTYHPGEWS